MPDIDPAAIGGPHAEIRRGTALHGNAPLDEGTGGTVQAIHKTLIALRNKSHAGLDLHEHLEMLKGAVDEDGNINGADLRAVISGLKRRALAGADLSSQIAVLENVNAALGGDHVPDPGFVPQEGNGAPVETGHTRPKDARESQIFENAQQQQAALIRDPAKKAEQIQNKPMGRSAELRNANIDAQDGKPDQAAALHGGDARPLTPEEKERKAISEALEDRGKELGATPDDDVPGKGEHGERDAAAFKAGTGATKEPKDSDSGKS